MTDEPTASASIAAGWYPDASDSTLVRWWDGSAWTAHTAPLGAGAGAGSGRPLLPADRPVYSPFIWIITLLPLLSYASLFAWTPDFAALSTPASDSRFSPFAIYTPGYFVILGTGWVLYGLIVLLAARDVIWLRRQGVVRPFHWAWAFLGGLVYVIGRTVIVRRVAAPRGLTPIWVMIAVFVVGIAISIVWTALLTAQVIDQVRPAVGG